MGIRGLNVYFKRHTGPKSIQTINVGSLAYKTIVFDTSIYIYKFLETGQLMENMFLLIAQCKQHNITPLFVFDGKPLPSKNAVLQSRYLRKQNAYEKYMELSKQYKESSEQWTKEEQAQILKQIEQYRKRSIRVKNEDIVQLKRMMDELQIYYCDAPHESDVVCAYYVQKGIAWACVTDDMDLFAYNCPRVLREWNIYHEETMLYDFEAIKKDICLSNKYVCMVLLLVGHDYTDNICGVSPYCMEQAMDWYREYMSRVKLGYSQPFLQWLKYEGYVSNEHVKQIKSVLPLYDVPENMILKKHFPASSMKTFNRTPSWAYTRMNPLMLQHGIIFI